MGDHDADQKPLCPLCESEFIDEQGDEYIFNYACRSCKGVFDHPLWVEKDEGPVVISLANAQAFARQQLDAIPPSKYEVSPQEAYAMAHSPYGALKKAGDEGCRGCGWIVMAYSSAGMNEVKISRMCEPCFDFTMIHPDDRDETESNWMSLVKYKEQG